MSHPKSHDPNQPPNQRAELVYLEPATMKQWLERGGKKNFRKHNPNHHAGLVRTIDELGYELNGQPICLRSDGTVADSQHRLRALIELDMSVWVWVIFGVDNDYHIDTGKKRSAAEMLKHHGHSNTASQAALAARIWRLRNGIMSEDSRPSKSPSSAEILAIVEANPQMLDSIRFVKAACDRQAMSHTALLTFVHYIGSSVDADRAAEFVSGVGDGVGLSRIDPRWHLRNLMLNERNDKKKLHKLPTTDVLARMIKAWNAFLADRSMSVLKWAASKEEFPQFDGYPRDHGDAAVESES